MEEVDELEQKDKNHEKERTAWSKSEAELKSEIRNKDRSLRGYAFALSNRYQKFFALERENEELKKKLASCEKQLGSYGKIKKLIEEDLAGDDTSS